MPGGGPVARVGPAAAVAEREVCGVTAPMPGRVRPRGGGRRGPHARPALERSPVAPARTDLPCPAVVRPDPARPAHVRHTASARPSATVTPRLSRPATPASAHGTALPALVPRASPDPRLSASPRPASPMSVPSATLIPRCPPCGLGAPEARKPSGHSPHPSKCRGGLRRCKHVAWPSPRRRTVRRGKVPAARREGPRGCGMPPKAVSAGSPAWSRGVGGGFRIRPRNVFVL